MPCARSSARTWRWRPTSSRCSRSMNRAATPERVTAMRDALSEIADKVDFVGEVHDVRVRQADGGEIVNFHCLVDPALKVAEVHEKVDEVERALRQRFPSIKRVIGHAEPATATS